MGLRSKFNLILLVSFAFGLLVAGYLSKNILINNAKHEVTHNAELLMEVAKSIRVYTAEQIRPLLNEAHHDEFLPQTVPAFAATVNMQRIRDSFPEYFYKEAALNPTNPEHRATGWEKEVIEYFRSNPNIKSYSDVRETPEGKHLFLSRPFKITNKQCLVCHSSPEMAPAAMVKRYGYTNGFNWKHNEIIGAQLVSVPMSVPLQRAERAFQIFIIALASVFALVWLLLNIMLHFMVLRPVKVMVENANSISMGNMSVSEFVMGGNDEISSLAMSFNRMYRSLKSAVKLIDKTQA